MIIGQIANSTSIDQVIVIGIVLQNGNNGVFCYSANSILYNPELFEYFQNYYDLYVDYSAENSTAYLCYNVNRGENYPDFVDISFVWESLSAAPVSYTHLFCYKGGTLFRMYKELRIFPEIKKKSGVKFFILSYFHAQISLLKST